MKKLLCLIAASVALYIAYAVFWHTPILKASQSYSPPPAKDVTLSWPKAKESAVAAPGYGILGMKGSQTPVPVASTAKLITAMTVLSKMPIEAGQAGPTITLGQVDVAAYKQYLSEDGSSVPVKVGEKISERQALEAMMLPSANNIAYSLAIWAFGSMDNFLTFANNYAASLGMKNTHLVDASGFSPKSVSTAQDLTILALRVIDDPVLSKITSEPKAILPVAGQVKNVNWLLGKDGITGIKTGNTSQAGGCFVFSAQRVIGGQKVKVVGAVVGASDLAHALTGSDNLANSALDNFSQVTLIKKGQIVGDYSPGWQPKVNIVAAENLEFVMWTGEKNPINISIGSVSVPAAKHSQVGEANFIDVTNQSSLILENSINKPPILWRLLHPI